MLYIATHCDQGPVTSHEIAQHQGVPEPYLRQILALLSKDRLIQSNRGPQGGHTLGRPADDISLRDILITLEGQTTAIDQILALPCTIDVGREHCVIREVFLEVKEAVERILAGTSLATLVSRQREILKQRILVPLDLPAPFAALLPVIQD
jgi:Rrf2 family protein